MPQTQPWLSVLMPTLNGSDYLEQALETILLQRDSGLECLVVDGGSTDATLEISAHYQARMALKVLERPDSPNWVWSTNLALQYAAAPYACILHQDDRWCAGRLARMRTLLDAHADAALYAHAVCFIDAGGRRVGRWSCPWTGSPAVVTSQNALHALLVQNVMACPAPLFPVALARSIGGLDTTLWYTADWDFWLKLAAAGTVIYCGEALAEFRLHPQSQTSRRHVDAAELLRQMKTAVERHLPAIADPAERARVSRLAHFSIHMNTALASAAAGQWANSRRYLGQGGWLSPAAWGAYLHDSRLIERIMARCRARLSSPRPGLG